MLRRTSASRHTSARLARGCRICASQACTSGFEGGVRAGGKNGFSMQAMCREVPRPLPSSPLPGTRLFSGFGRGGVPQDQVQAGVIRRHRDLRAPARQHPRTAGQGAGDICWQRAQRKGRRWR